MTRTPEKSRNLGIRMAMALGIASIAQAGLAQNSDEEIQAEINTAFAESDYSAAEAALRKLITRNGESPATLFQLARAIHGQNDFDRAAAAYGAAREAGFQPAARIDYHLARIEAAQGNKKEAIALLETMADTSGPIAATVSATPEFADLADEEAFASVLDRLRPCPLAEQRQFDFWVGEWTVTAAGQPYGGAKSRIESIQNGCAVLENYKAGNFAGTSINFYDPTRKVWHQSWMSNTGNVFYAEGGLNDQGEMVLTDANHPISQVTGTINTVTWTPLEDGGVRQHWRSSTDGGASWQTVFDGYYSRAESKQ